MNKENNNTIALIVFFRKFISVFFSIFLNIYVLSIVNDVGLVIKYNLVGIIFEFIFNFLILRFINNKNAKIIYNSSFLELIICIILLLTLKENIYKYIYLFRILYALEKVSYAAPYEMIIMDSNNKKTMSNFLANVNILSSLATILTPVFSGFIIDTFSYNMLFVILGIEALIIIIISTRLKDFYISDRKLYLKGFYHKIKKYPHIKDIYKCMFFRRISSQGVITDLLPVILFLRLNSELSVGAYNTLFSVLSIFALSLLKIVNKQNKSKKFYMPISILIFIASVILVYYPSFITLMLYYIFMNTLGTIIESESCSIVYASIDIKELKEYNREHDIFFNIYMLIGQVISYSAAYILYTYFYNVNILSIIVSISMFFLIAATYYLQKTENYLETNMIRSRKGDVKI